MYIVFSTGMFVDLFYALFSVICSLCHQWYFC